MQSILRFISRRLLYIAVLLLIVIAALVGLARALTPILNKYHDQITYFASQQLHKPVSIERIDGTWHWLQPTIKLKNVQILKTDSATSILHIQELDIGIDIFRSLLHWQPELGSVLIIGSSVTITQQADGQWQLDGFTNDDKGSTTNQVEMLDALFQLNHFALKKININLIPQQQHAIKITDINLDLLSFGERHFIEGQLDLFRETKLPIELSAHLEGSAAHLDKLKSQFHILSQHISLDDWLGDVPMNTVKVSGDLVDVSVHGVAKGMTIKQLASNFIGNNLKFTRVTTNKTWAIEGISADIQFNHPAKQQSELLLKRWQLTTAGVLRPPNSASLTLNYQDKTHFQTSGVLDHLQLQFLEPLWQGQNSLPPVFITMITALKPQGNLQQLKWQVTKNAEQPLAYNIESNLQDLSWQVWQKIPAMSGVNGHIQFNAQQGSAVLQGNNTSAFFPLIFRQPIKVLDWYAAANWHQQQDGWQITSKDTHFSTEAGQAQSQLTLFIPTDNNASPSINLTSQVNFKQLTQQNIHDYLPTGILPDTVIGWLDDNILGLGKTTASLVLKGPLADFPFDETKSGTFVIQGQFQQAALHLSPGWPVASNVTGNLLFSGSSMDIHATDGEINGAKIINARVQIPYMGAVKPVILSVDGQAVSDASQALQFLHQSPLKVYLQQGLNTATASGPVHVNLAIEVPLAQDGNAQPVINGAVNLNEITLNFPAWNIVVNTLNGVLRFSENGLQANNLKGLWLGAPLTIAIIPASTTNNAMQIQFKTLLNLASLENQYHLPVSVFASGQTPIAGQISVAPKNAINLTVTSDLKGIQINLPFLLKKTTLQAIPLTIKGSLINPQTSQVSFTYGKEAAGIFQFSTQKVVKLKAGNITVGSSTLSPLPSKGLDITGIIPICSSAVWQQSLAKLKPTANQSALPKQWPVWLHGVVLNCQQLQVGNLSFNKTILKISSLASGWSIKLQSPQLDGHIDLPSNNSKQALQIQFQRLYLPSSTGSAQANNASVNPARFPVVQFSVNDLRYGNKKIGQVTGSLQPQARGALVSANIIQPGALNAKLQAQWQASPAATHLSATLSSQNVSQALQNMNLPTNLKSQNAQANIVLNWPGAPYQLRMNRLNGNITLQINDGLIDGLGKSTDAKVGFGRLLNVLSLQNLPDKLRGGFSNLGKSGFNFTKMIGNFQLNNGIATIQQATVASPVAGIALTGTISFTNQTYNMVMAVTPHVTSSAPIAATLVGGPLVGMAVWAANEVLSPALNAIAKYQYKITGTWSNPVVTKM